MNTKDTKSKTKMRMFARGVRKLTVAPVISLILFTLLYFFAEVFKSFSEYIAAVILLTLIPLCAYPLAKIIPLFREKGRQGERTLAMIMANVGYILSIVYALVFGVSHNLMTVFLTYLISGAVLFLINSVFGFKASAHACGLMGPVAVLAYFVGISDFAAGILSVGCGLLLFSLVFWCSLKIRRHTPLQYLAGALVPVIVFASLILILPV